MANHSLVSVLIVGDAPGPCADLRNMSHKVLSHSSRLSQFGMCHEADAAQEVLRTENWDCIVIVGAEAGDDTDDLNRWLDEIQRAELNSPVVIVSKGNKLSLSDDNLHYLSEHGFRAIAESALSERTFSERLLAVLPVHYKVLLVDDDPDDIELVAEKLTEALEGVGTFDIDKAKSYSAAKLQLNRNFYDVIALDFMLDGGQRADDLFFLIACMEARRGKACKRIVISGGDPLLKSRGGTVSPYSMLTKQFVYGPSFKNYFVEEIKKGRAKKQGL